MNVVSCFSEDLSEAPEEKLKKLKYECKAHMQVCALLSQLHRHKEALNHAKIAISISHYLVKDVHKLIKYYVERMKPGPDDKLINLNEDEDKDGNDNSNSKGCSSKKHIDFLYDSQLSLLGKTAIKLLPIADELEKRLVPEEVVDKGSFEGMEKDQIPTKQEKSSQDFNTVYDKVDMRNLLGYLNQSDWIWSLNIGNIMQISPLTMQDIYTTSSIEYELSRELVLEKICFLAVSYFCVSTELRFIVQMKQDEDITGPVLKRKESEYFHGKALDIAAGFLPSECPLVNHILMSYQKHHAPSQQVIDENEEYQEDLKVIRPLQGIESNKHQPIVRSNHNLKVTIPALKQKLIAYPEHYLRVTNVGWKSQAFVESKTVKTQTAISQKTANPVIPSSANSSKYFSVKSSKKNMILQSNNPGNSKKM